MAGFRLPMRLYDTANILTLSNMSKILIKKQPVTEVESVTGYSCCENKTQQNILYTKIKANHSIRLSTSVTRANVYVMQMAIASKTAKDRTILRIDGFGH